MIRCPVRSRSRAEACRSHKGVACEPAVRPTHPLTTSPSPMWHFAHPDFTPQPSPQTPSSSPTSQSEIRRIK